MKRWIPLLLGGLVALLKCALLETLPTQWALDAAAVVLAAASAVYFGSALAEKHGHNHLPEGTVAMAGIAMALAGLWHSPLWLVAGYVLHGFWDLLHHPHRAGARLEGVWYPPACLGYDWVVAAYVAVRLV